MIKLGKKSFHKQCSLILDASPAIYLQPQRDLLRVCTINKASEDAAGLAIMTNLNPDNRIFTQGIRSLNDGLSAGNIAEGAMEQLGNIIISDRAWVSRSSLYGV